MNNETNNLTLYYSFGMYQTGTLHWVFDPGRENILYGTAFNDNGDLVYEARLGRNYYYEVTKINAINKKANRRNKSAHHHPINIGLTENHLKTANYQQLKAAFVWQSQNFDVIWARKVEPQRKYRDGFFLWSKKREVIYSFLSSLQMVGYDDYIIYYGSGQFPSGGRGERSVPCKWVKTECMNHYVCIEVDEFRTSQVCPLCFERMEDVYKLDKHGRRKKVRGLK